MSATPTSEHRPDPPGLAERLADCRQRIAELGRLAIGFSGGVDSTLLTALAVETLGGENVLAVVAVSPVHPEAEVQAARDLAAGLQVRLIEAEIDLLDDDRFRNNPPDRCYHCKKRIFNRVRQIAADAGFLQVASGANADDAGDYRPGLRAGSEIGVRRPLMDAGLTKDDIRALSRAMGLPTWDKPAQACLASRVPYGEPITAEKLRRIEQAERLLGELGFQPVRCRDHGRVARLEIAADQFPEALTRAERIVEALGELGWTYVALDLAGFRSGAMNEVL